jgi:hypothetical protein
LYSPQQRIIVQSVTAYKKQLQEPFHLGYFCTSHQNGALVIDMFVKWLFIVLFGSCKKFQPIETRSIPKLSQKYQQYFCDSTKVFIEGFVL